MRDVFIRNEREQQLVQYARKLAEQIEETAAIYDESGAFPLTILNCWRRQVIFD